MDDDISPEVANCAIEYRHQIYKGLDEILMEKIPGARTETRQGTSCEQVEKLVPEGYVVHKTHECLTVSSNKSEATRQVQDFCRRAAESITPRPGVTGGAFIVQLRAGKDCNKLEVCIMEIAPCQPTEPTSVQERVCTVTPPL